MHIHSLSAHFASIWYAYIRSTLETLPNPLNDQQAWGGGQRFLHDPRATSTTPIDSRAASTKTNKQEQTTLAHIIVTALL